MLRWKSVLVCLIVSSSSDFLHILQRVWLDRSRFGNIRYFSEKSFGAAIGIQKCPKVLISRNPVRDKKGVEGISSGCVNKRGTRNFEKTGLHFSKLVLRLK